jgi:hypothetical protein
LIGAYASVALVCLASVAVGQAVLSAAGRRELVWMSGPIGLAMLLAAAGIVAELGGRGAAIAIVLAVLTVAGGAFAIARRPPGLASELARALPAMGLALLVASIPFIVAGRVGILGVGLVNDDMASHLLLASWIDEGFVPEPVLVDQGYPLGPHAIVAGLETGLGTGYVNAFAGLTMAIPALTAMVAFGALDRLGAVARTLSSAATALPYLVAAYLAQEAFKEPILALALLAFALYLPLARSPREALPLGVIAAGVVYVYSFPGLVWLVGTAAVWGAIELARRPELRTRAALRGVAAATAAAIAVGLAMTLPDISRILDFADFRALDPDRANEGGLGNLRDHLSPLEGLGVWPTSEFRLSAGAGSLPAAAFYAGAALGAAALALGLPRWIRRWGTAVPAALATALVVYLGARGFGTVYTSAKALAIAAPLVTIIALGGLLGDRPVPRLRLAFAAALLVGIGLSSFLVLRQAPVGPTDHGEELAELRPLVEGEKLLFLGRDNFVLYELRGSRPFTHVRNFYDPYFVRPNFELENVGSKFDFDSVTAETLARFPYVITTRAAYASGPPPRYRPVAETANYVLWRQGASPLGREPVEPGAEPTAELDCRGDHRPRGIEELSAIMTTGPVRAEATQWSPDATISDGEAATIEIELPEGAWQLSLEYDATRPVTLVGEGLDAELPGNLDYRGVAPFWPAGEVVSEGGPVEVTATVEGPSAAGKLIGASSVAHLGALAATASEPGHVRGIEAPHPGASARLVPAEVACGRQADWIDRGR